MWEAYAEYADGSTVCEYFPYRERGNYSAECNRQYELECWLIERDAECTFYSVAYVEAN